MANRIIGEKKKKTITHTKWKKKTKKPKKQGHGNLHSTKKKTTEIFNMNQETTMNQSIRIKENKKWGQIK